MRFDSRDLTIQLTAQHGAENTDLCCACTDTQCPQASRNQPGQPGPPGCQGCTHTQPGCQGASNRYDDPQHARAEVHLALLRQQLQQTLAGGV